jgi:predicted MFS family arabinose efflux permease
MAAGRLRAAHVALAAIFVAFGTVDGTWAARLPALKHRLGLDDGKLGVVLFLVTLTATLLLPVAGWLAARFGSRSPMTLGLLLACSGLTAAAFAPSFATLIPAACLIGAGWGTVDVAANAHGVVLEERLGRPVLSALHGMWSFGLLAGSGIAAGAAAASISPRLQFPLVAGAATLVLAVFVSRLLPGTAADVDSAHFALPRGALALPAFLTFCALFVESAAMNWTAVFLAGPVRASGAVAAGGVVVYAISMAFARLVGDRLTGRWGVGGLAQRSGALTCVGMALALATRSPVPALVGFGLVGAGCAAIVPALFRVAGSVPGVASGAGIAAVATAGYTGAVINGPAIGFLARGVGLTLALTLIVVGAALVAILGPRLER